MYRFIVLLAVIGAGGLAGGCATIIEGSSQSVSIEAVEPTGGLIVGAVCNLASPGIGSINVTTPGTATMKKSKHNVEVRCRKEGYTDGAAVLGSDVAGVLAGNIIAGGLIGAGVDLATGAAHKYDARVAVTMQRLPPPPEQPKSPPGKRAMLRQQ